MNDKISINSDLLDDEMKLNKKTNDNYAIMVGLLSQLLWAFVGLQLKSFRILFPEDFSNTSVAFWRSVSICSLAYYFIKKNNIQITPLTQIQNKFWFGLRNLGMLSCLLLWVIMNYYLRLSTCQCISGCHPIIVLYLSVFILKEKFHVRYLVGILLCLFGTLLIVLNERAPVPVSGFWESQSKGNVVFGLTIGLIHLSIYSAAVFAQKFLCNENMGGEVQNFYLGSIHSCLAFGLVVVNNHSGISNPLYVLYGLSNGVLFYSANYYTVECLKSIPISKFMPITYVGTVYVFILGCFILGEPIYLTDLLGSALIVAFQFYNVWVPIQ